MIVLQWLALNGVHIHVQHTRRPCQCTLNTVPSSLTTPQKRDIILARVSARVRFLFPFRDAHATVAMFWFGMSFSSSNVSFEPGNNLAHTETTGSSMLSLCGVRKLNQRVYMIVYGA